MKKRELLKLLDNRETRDSINKFLRRLTTFARVNSRNLKSESKESIIVIQRIQNYEEIKEDLVNNLH